MKRYKLLSLALAACLAMPCSAQELAIPSAFADPTTTIVKPGDALDIDIPGLEIAVDANGNRSIVSLPDRYIFLPAAWDEFLGSEGGMYWSNTLGLTEGDGDPRFAYGLFYMNFDKVFDIAAYHVTERYAGNTIRTVCQ